MLETYPKNIFEQIFENEDLWEITDCEKRDGVNQWGDQAIWQKLDWEGHTLPKL